MGGDDDEFPSAEGDLPLSDAEEATPLSEDGDEARTQRGTEVDSIRYIEMGRVGVGVGPDGMPVMGGDAPGGPEPGLTLDNFVCLEAPNRPQCVHLRELLIPAPGITKGLGREMKLIRSFCRALATASELWDLANTNVYACSAREPQDLVTIRLIKDFRQAQRDAAIDSAQKSARVDL